MPESKFFLYLACELALLLLLVTIFLLTHVRKLKKLIAKFEDKIANLRKQLGLARRKLKGASKDKGSSIAYAEYLERQIENTRKHHTSLKPDRDIVLDIEADAPMERQVASLRHALLVAEKEADVGGAPNWDVLQNKFEQVIQFYNQGSKSALSEEEHEVLKKRIENLEGFKRLFFDMESKWEKAKEQAEDYYEQLMALGIQIGGGEQFEALMKDYSNVYNDVNAVMVSGGPEVVEKTSVIEIDNRSPSVGKMVIANQEEVQRLRNMTVDQHKVISELKKKLVNANSPELQKEMIAELSSQLDRQERFLKEAETCSQLLEDELNRVLEENQALRDQMGAGAGAEAESSNDTVKEMESLVEELSSQSRDLLNTITTLEGENKALQQRISEQSASAGGGEEMASKFETVQQELLNLQTQHIELEERYLELKMKS